jgi:rsbT co-antagonist protein RsbR
MTNTRTRLPIILQKRSDEILNDWIKEQSPIAARHKIKETELRQQSMEFLKAFQDGVASGEFSDISSSAWSAARDVLGSLSKKRSTQGVTASETATFVFSFKQALLSHMQTEYGSDAKALAEEVLQANLLIDKLGLYTTEIYQKSREEVISRQQQELLELSTPVVTLWEGVLALPLIGTLDSARTQVIMESLLQKIVETGSDVAIIDITGVPTVDTLVAQHLLKTVTAARLMGADCIISGIRPQIAQTIVHLGVELGGVTTKSNLKDAFALALKRTGLTVGKLKSVTQEKN